MPNPEKDFPKGEKLTYDQLMILSHMGRINRMVKAGMSLEAAIAEASKEESPDEYIARNTAALDALTARLLSPEYTQRFAEAHAISDPEEREAALEALKRENFESIDMEAAHRHVNAANRRAVAEGMLPPDVLKK
jgi:hypothetical protein